MIEIKKLIQVSPTRNIDWNKIREMIIYDMGGQAGWQPMICGIKLK